MNTSDTRRQRANRLHMQRYGYYPNNDAALTAYIATLPSAELAGCSDTPSRSEADSYCANDNHSSPWDAGSSSSYDSGGSSDSGSSSSCGGGGGGE